MTLHHMTSFVGGVYGEQEYGGWILLLYRRRFGTRRMHSRGHYIHTVNNSYYDFDRRKQYPSTWNSRQHSLAGHHVKPNIQDTSTAKYDPHITHHTSHSHRSNHIFNLLYVGVGTLENNVMHACMHLKRSLVRSQKMLQLQLLVLIYHSCFHCQWCRKDNTSRWTSAAGSNSYQEKWATEL